MTKTKFFKASLIPDSLAYFQVLKHLGEWGPYQKFLFTLLCIPACLPAAFLAFNQVLLNNEVLKNPIIREAYKNKFLSNCQPINCLGTPSKKMHILRHGKMRHKPIRLPPCNLTKYYIKTH